MKNLFILGLILVNLNAFAASDKGNGGDSCENKMRDITNDIESWLLNDEFIGIKLPKAITAKTYKSEMLKAVKKSLLSCTTDKVFIGRAEKTCKNYTDNSGKTRIVCNFDRMLKTKEREAYKLMHHELAGVAGFETNKGNEASVYKISNQISDFLHVEEVLRLGVRPIVDTSKYQGYMPDAKVIKDVTICSVTCSAEGTNISHNEISYGSISFAPYNEDTSSNWRACSEVAQEVDIASDRSSGEREFGINVNECSKILTGKYRGEKVQLVSEELDNEKTYIIDVILK